MSFICSFQVHEYLRSKLCSLYENDCIFDKFECCWNGNDTAIMTGSYNNFFRMFDRSSRKEVTYEASKEIAKPKTILKPRKVSVCLKSVRSVQSQLVYRWARAANAKRTRSLSTAWTSTRKSYIQLGIRQRTSSPLPPQTISSCCKTKSSKINFGADKVSLRRADRRPFTHTPTTYNFQQNTYFDIVTAFSRSNEVDSESKHLILSQTLEKSCHGCAYSKKKCLCFTLSSIRFQRAIHTHTKIQTAIVSQWKKNVLLSVLREKKQWQMLLCGRDNTHGIVRSKSHPRFCVVLSCIITIFVCMLCCLYSSFWKEQLLFTL